MKLIVSYPGILPTVGTGYRPSIFAVVLTLFSVIR